MLYMQIDKDIYRPQEINPKTFITGSSHAIGKKRK